MNSIPIGRLAPSPSGRMHLGNVCTFLIAWLSVKSRNGEMLLRIEDLDTERCTNEYAEAIRSDLLWLGLKWDSEMPQQRYRNEAYETAIDILNDLGLIYPCWCTRGVINASRAPHASDGHTVYPGTCRNLTPSDRLMHKNTPSLRIRVPDRNITFYDRIFGVLSENLQGDCGDYVIKKADGSYSYQLAVVVDDIAGGVTEVVRGHDLIGSCARQIWLTETLGGTPPEYMHVPMLNGPGGRKLSKRDLDLDMGTLRQNFPPELIIGLLASSTGMIEHFEKISLEDLLSLYDPQKLRTDDLELDVSPLLSL